MYRTVNGLSFQPNNYFSFHFLNNDIAHLYEDIFVYFVLINKKSHVCGKII